MNNQQYYKGKVRPQDIVEKKILQSNVDVNSPS